MFLEIWKAFTLKCNIFLENANMGFQATVVILCDALHEIKNDKTFAERLADAVSSVGCYNKPVDVPAGCHANPCQVLEVHHADYQVVMAMGGNTAQLFGYGGGYAASKEQILKNVADEMGFRLVKKVVKK